MFDFLKGQLLTVTLIIFLPVPSFRGMIKIYSHISLADSVPDAQKQEQLQYLFQQSVKHHLPHPTPNVFPTGTEPQKTLTCATK